jgi:predicted membrane chloride channel (bestrophin family)
MSYTYSELKNKTVAELREIAATVENESVKGHSQMNKEHLLVALCTALKIELREHHQVVGLDKTKVKARIKAMKERLAKAIEAKDKKQISYCHRQIHRQKRNIHKATV